MPNNKNYFSREYSYLRLDRWLNIALIYLWIAVACFASNHLFSPYAITIIAVALVFVTLLIHSTIHMHYLAGFTSFSSALKQRALEELANNANYTQSHTNNISAQSETAKIIPFPKNNADREDTN